MKILVTVGTTQFDELIEFVDLNIRGYEITFQIASGKYIPINHSHFKFSDDFSDHIKNNEIVITHAGAGSVYSLLEMTKKIIVVPNLNRIDKHQRDLAHFVEKNEYAFVAWELSQLHSLIESIKEKNFKKYEKDNFNKIDEISYLIKKLYF